MAVSIGNVSRVCTSSRATESNGEAEVRDHKRSRSIQRETRHGKVEESPDATRRIHTPRRGFARYAGDEGKVLVRELGAGQVRVEFAMASRAIAPRLGAHEGLSRRANVSCCARQRMLEVAGCWWLAASCALRVARCSLLVACRLVGSCRGAVLVQCLIGRLAGRHQRVGGRREPWRGKVS